MARVVAVGTEFHPGGQTLVVGGGGPQVLTAPGGRGQHGVPGGHVGGGGGTGRRPVVQGEGTPSSLATRLARQNGDGWWGWLLSGL